jgi:protein phosphatase
MFNACGVSEAGLRRANEDGFVSDPALRLFAVADGMGGHQAGEVASRLAIEAVTTFIRRSSEDTDFTWPYGIDDSLSFDGNRLRTAIHLGNRRVFRAAESRDDYSGMGTTITAVLINRSQLSIGSVGDSRLYVFRNGALEQVTRDDSWTAALLAHDPTVDPKQLASHALRNVLTNALGARDHVDLRIIERPIASGDVLLLCSDGLHGVLGHDQIRRILEHTTAPDAAARELVDAALTGGSRDNVTALVVRYEADR